MSTREFTGKTGDVWTWEETPETIEALKRLHDHTRKANELKLNRPNKPNA